MLSVWRQATHTFSTFCQRQLGGLIAVTGNGVNPRKRLTIRTRALTIYFTVHLFTAHLMAKVSYRPQGHVLCVVVLTIVTLSLLSFPNAASAQTCDPWVAKIVSSQGPIEAKRATQVSWEDAAPGNTYCAGAQIRVGGTPAIIRLVDDSIIKLDARTTMSVSEVDQGKPSVIDLIRGMLHFISRVPQRLTIKTPIHNGKKNFAMAQEFIPCEVAVVVAVHPLKPDGGQPE